MSGLEAVDAWTLAQRVARSACRLSLDTSLRHHFALADQARRCAISVPANIGEGYALGTRSQLVPHLRIALGWASDLWCHIDLARDPQFVAADQAAEARQDRARTISVLVGLLTHLGARAPE